MARDNTMIAPGETPPEINHEIPKGKYFQNPTFLFIGDVLDIGVVATMVRKNTKSVNIPSKMNQKESSKSSSDSSDEDSSESSESEIDIETMFKGKDSPARKNFRPQGALSPRSYSKFKVRF